MKFLLSIDVQLVSKECLGREDGKKGRKYRSNNSNFSTILRNKSQNPRPDTIYRYGPDVNYIHIIDCSGDALI